MLLVDAAGRIVLANRPLCALFGHGPEALIGAKVESLLARNQRDMHVPLREAFVLRASKRKMNEGRDVLGLNAQGKLLPLDVSLEPVDVDGSSMVIATVLDMRGRHANKERVRRIMDAASCTMLVIDEAGTINYVNKAVTVLLGYEKAELIGQKVEAIVPKGHRRAHPVFRRSYFTSPDRITMRAGRVVDVLHKDGRTVPAEIALDMIEDEGARGVVATIVDLSERISAERVLSQRARELERLNASLTHFARGISHDLKAPLSSIAGLMTLCQEDLQDGDLREVAQNLEKVTQIAEHSLDSIEEVLKIAVPSEHANPCEPVDVAELIQSTWQDLIGGRKDCRLVVAADMTAPVVTERAMLRSAMQNLLSNALKYRDPDRPLVVCVMARRSGGLAHVSIADNGRGIPEAFVPEVFTLFKRYGENSGTGIGLHLVQRNIELLGGTITCTSREGEGARFEFTLPDRLGADA